MGLPKVVALIPARGGSKSVPMKNIKLINGRPLIYWVIDTAAQSRFIDEIYIATDSREIEEVVQSYGSDKVRVIGRSATTATDTASTESVMLEFAHNYPFEFIILIQATSPLLEAEALDQGVQKVLTGEADSVLSVVRQKRFIWEASEQFVKPVNYIPEKRPRRQEFEGFLVENGAFYVTSRERFITTSCRISGNIAAVEMPEETYFEIDEPSDWIIVEKLLQKRNAGNNSLENRIRKIRMLLTDSDGVLTDGGMYYSENGDELKKFNTKDGMGIALLRERGIKVGIITSEKRDLIQNRARKLKIEDLYMDVADKLSVLEEIKNKYGLKDEEIAYIGDDVNDIKVLKKVGFGCSPADGSEAVKDIASYITKANGGNGVLREVAELILKYHSINKHS